MCGMVALTWSGSARQMTGPRSDANRALSLLVLRNDKGTPAPPAPKYFLFLFISPTRLDALWFRQNLMVAPEPDLIRYSLTTPPDNGISVAIEQDDVGIKRSTEATQKGYVT